MYKVDIENKKLIEIPETLFSQLDIKERFDIQEWIEKTPGILSARHVPKQFSFSIQKFSYIENYTI